MDKRCGYDVPVMILLYVLNGAVRLDHSKDISVQVQTCISYDFHTLTPVLWKFWLW